LVFYKAIARSIATLLVLCACAQAQIVRPRHAVALFVDADQPPAATLPWQGVDLPYSSDQQTVWYRIRFEAPAQLAGAWAVYLPYLYGGGRLYLNGELLTRITEPGAGQVVRWERPHFVPVPNSLLHPGSNELALRVVAEPVAHRGRVPLLAMGPQDALRGEYEGRLFWVRTMSQFSLLATWIVGPLMLAIWWRRREETLYGLFGVAALLWGVRTLNLVIEVLPSEWWWWWRLAYHSATGGFAIILMVFLLRLANLRYPVVERGLMGFWLLGPIGFVLSGGSEWVTGRLWAGALIPICLVTLGVGLWAAWRTRTVELIALVAAIAMAVLAGVHDFLVTSTAPLLQAIAPDAAAHRVFLLHYAADLVLLVMGAILAARFIRTLEAIAQLNQTLETRVAEREQSLVEKFAQVGHLERQHAVDEERQRIVRDLHDGLGSQLFVTLSRVEVGRMQQADIVQALRECIADMRLTIEAMSPDDNDFLVSWGNFRFRWERQLQVAGLESSWQLHTQSAVLEMAPHAGLQLLRIAQEVLTNILKHARASQVVVRLAHGDGKLRLDISDNGVGMQAHPPEGGRGMVNMQSRARQLGARMGVQQAQPGTTVWVELELPPAQLPTVNATNAA